MIEAIVEELAREAELFAELDRLCRPDAVLATNTSALSVTEIAAATRAPERVVGMHFFNPAPLMPLVEIVRAELSGDEAVETAFAFGERIGKHPIRCHDTPGFVVNRVLIPLLNDCIRVLDEARVSPEDLDAGLKHGAGWPMGPCTLVDLVGIDVHVHASEALYEKLREPRMAPPPRLVAMRRRLLGRKSGRGFYPTAERVRAFEDALEGRVARLAPDVHLVAGPSVVSPARAPAAVADDADPGALAERSRPIGVPAARASRRSAARRRRRGRRSASARPAASRRTGRASPARRRRRGRRRRRCRRADCRRRPRRARRARRAGSARRP